MNAQELIKYGYKRCEDYLHSELMQKPQYFYQKKIYSDSGRLLYFINVYEYDWRDYPPKGKDYAYEAKLHLYVDAKADCIRIEFNCDTFDVLELEHYVLTGLYRRLYCVPDKYND